MMVFAVSWLYITNLRSKEIYLRGNTLEPFKPVFLFKLLPNISIYSWVYEFKKNPSSVNIYPSLLERIWKIDWTQELHLYFVLNNCMDQGGLLFLPYSFQFFPWGTCGYRNYWELGIHCWTLSMLKFNWLLIGQSSRVVKHGIHY